MLRTRLSCASTSSTSDTPRVYQRRNWDHLLLGLDPNSTPQSESELKTQGHLPSAIARVLRGLLCIQHSECSRVAPIRRRRRIVRVVQHIREGSLEAQPQVLADGRRFCQAGANCHRAGSLQNADPSVSYTSCANRRGCECVDVEIAARSPVSRNRITHNVRTNNRPGQLRIGVALVKLWVDRRSQIRTCFDQSDCVHAPTTECSVD